MNRAPRRICLLPPYAQINRKPIPLIKLILPFPRGWANLPRLPHCQLFDRLLKSLVDRACSEILTRRTGCRYSERSNSKPSSSTATAQENSTSTWRLSQPITQLHRVLTAYEERRRSVCQSWRSTCRVAWTPRCPRRGG
ncbi:hypothetical protein N431DRAFT_437488 [Stipitochalara longipes BDJ]|nr:hypothetical protein N431DRAFT_437488 [Stipitochalara longipes BDJ]